MLFGDRLKMLREDKDVTQKELGVAVGVSDRVIGYYESNDRFPKDENILKSFADYFNVSVDYLLGRTEIKNFKRTKIEDRYQEDFDEETRAIARDMKNLPNDKKDLLKQLIKSMSVAGDEELNK